VPIPANRRNVIVLAALVGISLVILTFNMDTSSIRSEHKSAAYLLIGGVWLLAAALVALESALGHATRRSAADLVVFAAVSGGLWSGFYLLHGAQRVWAVPAGVSGVELVRRQALHIANSIPVLYAYLFASLAVLALVLVWNRARGATRLHARWTAIACVVPSAIALALVAGASVDASRADVVSKLGTSVRGAGRWMEAEVLYREALRLRPSEDSYKVKLGLALSELGRGSQGREEERIRRLEDARVLLEEALAARPLSIDALANLAALHRIWSGSVVLPAEQARQFDLAESYYRRALERVPQRTALWNAWAATALERGDPATAFARLKRSFALDPDKPETHIVRGAAHLQAGAYDKAVADYDRALGILPTIQGAREQRALAWSHLTLVKPQPEMP
jgi:tetratricopeptide (TPR) repeat protein